MKKPLRHSSNRTPLALACAAALVSGSALAQEFTGLEEVIVTASKRTETLQEIGMSVTAISEREIENMGIDSYLDFAVRIPNLATAFQADGRFDANSPALRGVFGSGDKSSAATTGFYIDDVPITSALQPRVLDLQRIEVLRGPQGSLYGARSMGGTIRLITQQPSLDETYGSFHTTASSVADGDQNYAADGSLNIPLIQDKLGLRVAGYYGSISGVYDRVYDPTWTNYQTGEEVTGTTPAFDDNENVDDEKYWGGQVFMKWMVTEDLSITPKFMYQKIEADGLPFADVDPENMETPRFFDSEEPGEDEWWIASVVVNWSLDAGDITSTTAYYERDTEEFEEEHTFLDFIYGAAVGVPITPIESVLSTTSEYENVSHETRFTSSFDGRWNFTAGIFYADNQFVRGYPPAFQPGANQALNDAIGAPADIVPDDLIFITNQPEDVEELAIFGEVTFDVTDRLSLTAGGRWYDTTVDFESISDGFANGGPSEFSGSQSESGFNPKVMAAFDVTDDLNVYASAGKGFRIGGVNGQLSPTLCGDELDAVGLNPDDLRTYDSDELWSYEAGIKSKLANNRVSLNAAVFFIDWQDSLQVQRLACGFQVDANIGDVESTGFEVEMSAAPIEGLTIQLGFGYTETEVADAAGDGFPGYLKGDELHGIPDWTGTGSVEYVFPAFDSWDARLRADGNYYGESTSFNNGTVVDREAWEAINLRAGLMNETWDLTLFVDNAADERANLADNRSIAAEMPGRPRIVTNRPRTVGLEARYRF
ncbi:TonB-dependent receptor [Luminiphilus syltensis]|nr:TonB-dependent receptor [Luminiphilus syltensis]